MTRIERSTEYVFVTYFRCSAAEAVATYIGNACRLDILGRLVQRSLSSTKTRTPVPSN